MCENFICSKIKPPDHSMRLADQSMPEACFENANCEICELMYNCDYCIVKDNCFHGKTRTPKIRQTAMKTGRNDH